MKLEKFEVEDGKTNLAVNMYTGIYNNQSYELLYGYDPMLELLSNHPLNDYSKKIYNSDYYTTVVHTDELSDIIATTLFAKYKGQVYDLLTVANDLSEFTLVLSDVDNKSRELGFKYSHDLGKYTLDVKREDLDEILAYKRSIYEFVKNVENQNKLL